MKSPEVPANESDRLDTLQRMKILDTGPEQRFDRFTRISTPDF